MLAQLKPMKSVAILDPQSALALKERLQQEQIQCEIRTITEESGLEAAEVFVEDSQYELACETSEAWEAARLAEAEANSRKTCPKCRSPRALERVQDPHYEEVGLTVLRCRECGEAFPL